MRTLAIDIETYSSVSLQKCGVYAYAQSPDFEILLFGYAWDDGPVEVIDLARGESLPEELQNALYDPEILKTSRSLRPAGRLSVTSRYLVSLRRRTATGPATFLSMTLTAGTSM